MVDILVSDMMNAFRGPFVNVECDLAQIIKSCGAPPPLKCIALTKIAISLWQQNDIRDEIAKSVQKFYSPLELRTYLFKFRDKWMEVDKKVRDKIPDLLVPSQYGEAIKETVKMIGDQILNFLYYRLCSEANKIYIYLDHLRWTPQGMIDKLQTSISLIEHSSLSALEKYELACNACLEEKIHFFLAKLPENFIDEFVDVKKYRLVLFWTLHIRGEHERFFEIRKREFKFGSSNNKYLFEWAFDTRNEVAMQYIFEKFPDITMYDNLIYLTKSAVQDSSTICIPYMLSLMCQAQIHGLLAGDGYCLLKRFADDWRLRSYFLPTANCILKFLRNMDYLEALRTVLLCWKENVVDENECKLLLHEYVNPVRGNNESKFTTVCQVLLSALFALEAVDTVQLLLRKGTVSVKTQILYSNFGLKECFDLIINGKFMYLEMFVEEMLENEEDIDKFKKSFFENKGFEMCCSLVALSKYQILDEFLVLFYADVWKYKRELPYKELGKIISNILKDSTYMDANQLKAIDEFLYWCFDGEIFKMSNCKVDVFDKDSSYKEVHHQLLQQVFELVIKGELRLVKIYLKWAFYTKERILKIKNYFFEMRSFEICCHMITNEEYRLLDEFLTMFCAAGEISTFKYSLAVAKQGKIIKEISNLATPIDAKQSLEKFLNYSFEGNDEIVSLIKEMVIDQGKDIDIDCREVFLHKISLLMKASEWQLVDKYMKWAFSVDEKRVTESPLPSIFEVSPADKCIEQLKITRAERLADRERLKKNRLLHAHFSRRVFRRPRPTQ